MAGASPSASGPPSAQRSASAPGPGRSAAAASAAARRSGASRRSAHDEVRRAAGRASSAPRVRRARADRSSRRGASARPAAAPRGRPRSGRRARPGGRRTGPSTSACGRVVPRAQAMITSSRRDRGLRPGLGEGAREHRLQRAVERRARAAEASDRVERPLLLVRVVARLRRVEAAEQARGQLVERVDRGERLAEPRLRVAQRGGARSGESLLASSARAPPPRARGERRGGVGAAGGRGDARSMPRAAQRFEARGRGPALAPDGARR